jgi:group I intron endonuclease
MKISGIYIIQNILNKKLYVGSSVNVNGRLSWHKNQLKKNTHPNQKLQNAVNKYSLNNFNFSILDIVGDICLLKDKERFWIDNLNSRDNGYNITVDTYCPARELSCLPEYKQKVSKVHKGKIISEAHKLSAHIKNKQKFAPIYLVNPFGEKIKIHGIRKFCKDNGLSYEQIKSLRRKKIHHHKGWRLFNSKTIGIVFDFNHPMSDFQRKIISERAKKYIGDKNPNFKHGKYVKSDDIVT